MPTETLRLDIDSRPAAKGADRYAKASERMGRSDKRREDIAKLAMRTLDKSTRSVRDSSLELSKGRRVLDLFNRALSPIVKTADRVRGALSKLNLVVSAVQQRIKILQIIVGGFFALVGAAISAGLIAAVAKFGITAETAGSQFDFVFGNAGRSLRSFLDTWSEIAGLDTSQAEELAARVGNIALGFRFGTRDAASFSQSILTLAGDFASFTGRASEDVVNAFVSAISGEREPLEDSRDHHQRGGGSAASLWSRPRFGVSRQPGLRPRRGLLSP